MDKSQDPLRAGSRAGTFGREKVKKERLKRREAMRYRSK
jgi:hypothetical protein